MADISGSWRVHTPSLLKEIANNAGKASPAIAIPLQIFSNLLHAVGERAAQINDKELNALMARLTIYSCADPESPDYDADLTKTLLSV